MPDPQYKQYTPEEDKIYNEAMAKIKQGMQNGLSFNEACAAIDVPDEELKTYILDDALKVQIAELHYGKGLALPQVAETLMVPLTRVAAAHREMLEDVGLTAAELYRRSSPDMPEGGPVGNA
ncbi:MAG: hypothetical protein AB1805_08090 [Nitrospirota bacterium]